MSAGIFLEPIRSMPTFKKRFEIVERKGIGHPDTICDLVMNQVSIELSKMYLKETGAIQHHNMDKSLLVAGQSENKFGGGKITKPMKLVIGDRATFEVKGQKLPVEDVTISTAKKWFDNNLRFVKEEHVEYQLEVGTSSHELRSIFENPKSFVANDTSALVGYAPFTKTESSVLETEEYINSQNFKKEFPESGEDVKVMGFRNDNTLDLTIAMAFVDSHVDSENHYFKRKQDMLQSISEFHRKRGDFDEVKITMNNLDTKNKGIEGLYLTVLGTSADNADSGEVGRGNMANRVISLTRPAGSEATAGKNPVSHIGKIYNALSFKLAEEIQKAVPDLEEVLVWMYNVIGKPVNEPKAIIIQPISDKELDLAKFESAIKEIVEQNLNKMDEFCMQLASGKIEIA
ncbi:MAG: S-adenosylmethionine synthetase, S-adenosylmethionine synthetase [Thaumarchaeota archaeon CSP1-1]|nr:MAG: S-adenosylmethionine synthetase, S-adenosylmethionine synthetase [Thaumarchaeota archaeon CSP1-1]